MTHLTRPQARPLFLAPHLILLADSRPVDAIARKREVVRP